MDCFNILIVDDDPDVVQAAQLALSPHAHRIDAATSPEAVSELIRRAHYDCVLLDMNFTAGRRSGSEGMTTMAAIKVEDPTLAVVLMTAYGAVSLAVESLKRGADDFLLKPWRNDTLVAAVRAAATRTQSARQPQTLDVVERTAIAGALSRHDGNIARTAMELGVSRQALYRRMAWHGL